MVFFNVIYKEKQFLFLFFALQIASSQLESLRKCEEEKQRETEKQSACVGWGVEEGGRGMRERRRIHAKREKDK